MCVIVLVEDDKKRPSAGFITKAWNKNPDGGGVAWREVVEGSPDPVVKWKKGLKLEDMHHFMNKLPVPFVAHFRKKSIGRIEDQMCHPFPVAIDTSLDIEGSTNGYVFFHNGTWHRWDEVILNMAAQSGNIIPDGRWIDSRAMAWMASFLGWGFLEVIKAKGIAFGPHDEYVLNGENGWTRVEDIWVSNNEFNEVGNIIYNGHNRGWAGQGQGNQSEHHGSFAPASEGKKGGKVQRFYCRDIRCQTKTGLDEDGWCAEHRKKKSMKPEEHSLTTSTNSTSSTSKKGKNKVSPYQEVVDESREVARTKDPFLAQTFIDTKWKLGMLSKSQWKILSKEFDQLKRKRKDREKELAQTFGLHD